MRRVLYILGLLALLIQCSPLRSCALEEVAFGSSCHTPGEVAVAVAADGCATHDESHAPNCFCERPKLSPERAGVPAPTVPPVAMFSVPLPFDGNAVVTRHPPAASPAATSPPPLARCTPLLI